MKRLINQICILVLCISCKQEVKQNIVQKPNLTASQRIAFLKIQADSLYERNEYSKAINYYDTLVELDPNNGDFYYNRAFSFGALHQNNPGINEKEISDYLKCIELGYKKDACYYNIGIEYMFMDDSLALYYFKKASEINPTNPKIKMFINELNKKLDKPGEK